MKNWFERITADGVPVLHAADPGLISCTTSGFQSSVQSDTRGAGEIAQQ